MDSWRAAAVRGQADPRISRMNGFGAAVETIFSMDTSDTLRDKYNAATRVKPTNKGRLRLHKRNVKIPSANDLIFIKNSPDYCKEDPETGSLGTTGRVCVVDSEGMDGCNLMCCGRGYNTIKTRLKERCKCKFHWCCYVECQTCTKPVELTVCK